MQGLLLPLIAPAAQLQLSVRRVDSQQNATSSDLIQAVWVVKSCMLSEFDIYVTVHHLYNKINSRLDAFYYPRPTFIIEPHLN